MQALCNASNTIKYLIFVSSVLKMISCVTSLICVIHMCLAKNQIDQCISSIRAVKLNTCIVYPFECLKYDPFRKAIRLVIRLVRWRVNLENPSQLTSLFTSRIQWKSDSRTLGFSNLPIIRSHSRLPWVYNFLPDSGSNFRFLEAIFLSIEGSRNRYSNVFQYVKIAKCLQNLVILGSRFKGGGWKAFQEIPKFATLTGRTFVWHGGNSSHPATQMIVKWKYLVQDLAYSSYNFQLLNGRVAIILSHLYVFLTKFNFREIYIC